jgi:hypothetical protein
VHRNGVSNLIRRFIIVTTAATLNAHGIVSCANFDFRGYARSSAGNSLIAPQAGQVVLSKGTRCPGDIPEAIAKPQLPQR